MSDYEVRLLDFEGDLMQVVATEARSDREALEQAAKLTRTLGATNYLVRRFEEVTTNPIH